MINDNELFNKFKQMTENFIRERERAVGMFEGLFYTSSDANVKMFAFVLKNLAKEEIARTQIDGLLLEMIKQTSDTVAGLTHTIRTMNIKNRDITMEMDRLQSWKGKYEEVFGDLIDIIKIKKREAEEMDRFGEEWRKRNK